MGKTQFYELINDKVKQNVSRGVSSLLMLIVYEILLENFDTDAGPPARFSMHVRTNYPKSRNNRFLSHMLNHPAYS